MFGPVSVDVGLSVVEIIPISLRFKHDTTRRLSFDTRHNYHLLCP